MAGYLGGQPQMAGLLGANYNPADMRKQMLWQALMQGGLGLLSQGPSKTPIGIGDSLAAFGKGGIEGAQAGQQNYMEQGLLAQQMEQQQQDRLYNRNRDSRQDAWTAQTQTRQKQGWQQEDQSYGARRAWLETLPPDQRALAEAYPDQYANQYLQQQFDTSGGIDGGNEAGLNMVYWRDENNRLHGGQLLKGGGIKEVPLPEGAQWAPGMQMLDVGTGFQGVDKRLGPQQGDPVVPKDLEGAARQTEIGKGAGEAAALHSSLASKYPGLEQVVTDLEKLADEATYTQTGQAYNWLRKETGLPPTDAAVARAKYIAMVDNQVLPMLRDTFGAQFTVVEGESLRATLGDPDKTPEEKKAVLRAFIEQKVRNMEASGIQGGVQQPYQPPPRSFEQPSPEAHQPKSSNLPYGTKIDPKDLSKVPDGTYLKKGGKTYVMQGGKMVPVD